MRQPTYYIPHGGGPCFYMDWTMGPPDTWERMAGWLRTLVSDLPERPRALLVVSAHWEAERPTVTTGAGSTLLFDYYGFPAHTYELTWPVAGEPRLAGRVRALLEGAGFESAGDGERGLDHGVFVPLKLSVPEADIPVVQLSLVSGLDTAAALGRSERFDGWLAESLVPAEGRAQRLEAWQTAPDGRACHPREEHLLPLMVAAGAAEAAPGQRVFADHVMGVLVSAYRFG